MIGLFGLLFGSFFNVCIYRIPREVPLAMPPSHCYRCGRRVAWYDNIPLLSYWLLRGRCRQCGAPFSMRYFLIELLTGALFLATVLVIGHSLAVLPALVLTSLLIIATFTDIDHWIIPDRISLGGLAAGLVLAAITPIGNAPGNPLAQGLIIYDPRFDPLLNALAGAAIGFLVLWLIGVFGTLVFRKEAMGFGDVKLFAMFGAFCGIEPLPYILLIACLIGTLVGGLGIFAGWLARHRPVPAAVAPLQLAEGETAALMSAYPLGLPEREVIREALDHPGAVGALRHHLPFGPSLAVAAWVSYLWHEPISQAIGSAVLRLSNWVWGF